MPTAKAAQPAMPAADSTGQSPLRSAQPAMPAADPPTIKGLRVAEPRAGVDEYLARKITGGRAAYKASLDILLCHMADFHRLMLGIICRKHGLDFDEVLAEVEEDEEYKNMMVNPAVYMMRYADEEETVSLADKILADTAEPKKPRRKIKFVTEEDDSGEAASGEAVSKPAASPGTKQVQLTGEAATAAKATAAGGRKVVVKKKASKPKATEEA